MGREGKERRVKRGKKSKKQRVKEWKLWERRGVVRKVEERKQEDGTYKERSDRDDS